MKIIISDYTREYLTDDEYKYLLLLEFNQNFEVEVNKIRLRLNIPYQFSYTQESISEFKKHTNAMMKKLNIPINLSESIEGIILDGRVYSSKFPIFVYSPEATRERKAGKFIIPAADPNFPFIQLRKRISKGQMIKAIKGMWKEIEHIMEEFDKSSSIPKLVSHIRIRDIQEDILIYRYGKSGPKPNHRQIKQKLEREHKIFLDEESIRKKFSNMGKLLSGLGFI